MSPEHQKTPLAKPKKETSVSPKSVIWRLRKGYLTAQKQKEEEKKARFAEAMPKEGIAIPYPMAPMFAPQPAEKKEAAPPPVPEGIEIVRKMAPRAGPAKFEERPSLSGVNIFYPLRPRAPKKGEFVYAYANIKWDPKTSHVIYKLVEPEITAEDKEMIDRIIRELEDRLDIDVTKIGTVKAREMLRAEVEKVLLAVAPTIDIERKRAIIYYVERDTAGLDKIDALMSDPNVEDLSCDGVGIPVYIYHRDPRFASIRTNVIFETTDELNTFVSKLAQKCNKTISVAEPLLDGTLPDGSRIQATLGTDIARKGSNFTIRKFTEKPLTPVHIVKFKTLDSLIMAYLWLAVENNMSILISGGTATGKTALLNSVSCFIRPELKVVSIEDTAELRLALPHWIPHVARTPMSIKGKIGEVSLFDLLKSSLRQRPDYLILGEVRGKEAYVLFQQIATGHPAIATIHAASISQLIDRLITPPISLPAALLENIDVVVFLTLSRLKGTYVRRADTVVEITGIHEDRPVTHKVFEWKPITDTFEITGRSVLLKKIARKAGLTEESVKEELIRRKIVIDWMLGRGIMDYKDVARVLASYYSTPESVMELIKGTE